MRVLAVAGSSGGHIFPALSFLEALSENDNKAQCLLVLPRKGIGLKALPQGIKIEYIADSLIPSRLDSKGIRGIINFFRGSAESLVLLLKFKPQVVVGFGSINSFSVVFFAWLLRIKTLIHEQNVVPGRANSVLAKFADRIAVSFNETAGYLKVNAGKIILTGNPVRRQLRQIEKKEALEHFGFSSGKLTILVMGGSQGSRSINSGFLNSLSGIADRNELQVIHLAGEKDLPRLEQGYKDLGIHARLFAFFDEMQYAYSAADIAVCRAGASTVSELIKFRLPAIMVPYPFAYAHQLQNARVLQESGSAVVINDADLGTGALQKEIERVLGDRSRIEKMRSGYKNQLEPGSDIILAKEAVSLVAV